MYAPEEIGILAVFVSFSSVLSTVLALRVDQAIVLAKTKSDAVNLACVSVLFIVLNSAVIAIFSLLTWQTVFDKFVKKISVYTFLLAVVAAMLTSVVQVMQNCLIRYQQYEIISRNRVFQSSLISVFQLIIGTIRSQGLSLVMGDLIGRLFSTCLLGRSVFKKLLLDFSNVAFSRQLVLLKIFKKYPLIDLFAALLNIISYQAHAIIFPVKYGIEVAGFYFMVVRVVQMPMSLIAAAYTDVFKQMLADPMTDPKQYPEIFIRMMLSLIKIAIIPSVVIFLFGKQLFIFAFGEQWGRAGEFAQILSPLFLVRFVTSPLSFFIYIAQKIEYDLVGQALLAAIALSAVYYTKTPREAILFTVVLQIVVYLVFLFCSWRIASAAKRCNFG